MNLIMANEVANLLLEQNYKICSLKQVLVNFKKFSNAEDPESSFHAENPLSRLSNLHVKLLQTAMPEEQKIPDFVEEEILTAENVYHETADILQEMINRLTHDYN